MKSILYSVKKLKRSVAGHVFWGTPQNT